jgi:glutamate-5-semialdehyde dehydrogenase
MNLESIGRQSRLAFEQLSRSDSSVREAAVQSMAQALAEKSAQVLDANREDVRLANKAGLSPALVERLTLSDNKIADRLRPAPAGRASDGRDDL